MIDDYDYWSVLRSMILKWDCLMTIQQGCRRKDVFLDMVSTVSASFKSGNLNEMSGKQG